MSISLTGGYELVARIGVKEIVLSPQSIVELSIIQDLNKLLPSFRMRCADPTGIMTHLQPFDSSANTFDVSFCSSGQDAAWFNSFTFKIYRRKPESQYQMSMVYDVVGLLDAPNLYSPSLSRSSGVGKTIKEFLIQIASELGCDLYDISSSLDYVKPVLQPNWTNNELLNYLRSNMEGVAGEGFYKIFISCSRGKKVFTCLTWNELSTRSNIYKFVIGQKPVNDFYPIMNYKIFDNYYSLGACGNKQQNVEFFDYYTSTYIEDTVYPTGMVSLSDYFMVDGNDPNNSDSMYFGRSTEETTTFGGRSKGLYYSRLSNMSKMWADTIGIQDLRPGAVVLVMFPEDGTGAVANYQYNGLWMVERVIHTFGNAFITRMLLTRNGVDTALNSTLVPAENKSAGIPTFVTALLSKVPEFTGTL